MPMLGWAGEGWELALWLVVTLRVALGMVGALSVRLQPVPAWTDRPYLLMGRGEPWASLIGIWQRWDARWYQEITEYGYHAGNGTAHFQPLYPLLTRGVVLLLGGLSLGGHMVWAQLVVSSVAFAGAMWLLYCVARLDLGRETARLAVLLVASFPTGFFLLAPYTEGLYLLCSLAAFWFARTGHPWRAGAAGAAATLTRPVGLALVVPLAALYLQGRGGRRPGLGLLAAGGPVLGMIAFSAYTRLVVGETTGTLDLARQWGQRFVPPWQGVGDSLAYLGRTGDPLELLNLICLGGGLGLTLWAVRRLPVAYALYAVPYLGVLFCTELLVSPYASDCRYTLVLFPVFLALAVLLTGRIRLAAGWMVTTALLQVTLFIYWLHWGFVA